MNPTDKGETSRAPSDEPLQPTFGASERLLSDSNVARMLDVAESTVRNGYLSLPFVKIGRLKRTKLSDVLKLIEQRTVTKRRVKRPDGEIEEIDLTTGNRRLLTDEETAS